MVRDTINAIQEAERKADQILEQAQQVYDEAVRRARQEAIALKERSETESRAKAAQTMQGVRLEGEEQLRRAREEAAAQAQILYQKAALHRETAVEAVLEVLFE